MIWNREYHGSARFREYDMTASLPRDLPAQALERANNFARPQQAEEQASDRHFDLACGHGQWHTELGPDRQALPDGIGDVRLSLGLCLSLADTARDRRAVGDEHPVFVLMDADHELHAAYQIGRASCRERVEISV